METEIIRQSLEDAGLRCTPQRHCVMTFLMEHSGHPTAAEIYEAVNSVDPRLSRATTYNNLRDLVEAGLVREVAVEGRAARFDAKNVQHHHFICDRCGTVEDLEYYALPKPAAASLGKRVVRECELIIRGLCSRCAPRESGRRAGAKARLQGQTLPQAKACCSAGKEGRGQTLLQAEAWSSAGEEGRGQPLPQAKAARSAGVAQLSTFIEAIPSTTSDR